MKLRVKNDSWCYTVSNSSSRNKVKRITNKQHRRQDKKEIEKELNEGE